MLLQAMLFQRKYTDAFAQTDQLFHMNEKKKILEAHFARKN